MKQEALLALGLNRKEVAVYLANLQAGSSLVQKIASMAKMNRTSTYDILHTLERQGFVSHMISAGKKYYQATPPTSLFGIIKEKENLLQDALGELEQLQESVIQKPSIEVFVGRKGIKNLFTYVLQHAKKLDALSSLDQILKLFKYEFPHFVEERKKLGIPTRIIIDKEPLDPDAPYRVLKKKHKTLMWLFTDHILYISLEKQEPIGVLIKEPNFYKTQKIFFDTLWDVLPEPKKDKV